MRYGAVFSALLLCAGCRGGITEPPGNAPATPGRTEPAPQLVPPIVGGSDPIRQQVIRFFAPVIYQDIEDRSEADLFTRITFDGNWYGGDNWEHTYLYPKRAYVYASLIEDPSRYFLHYGLFWPRDWCSDFCSLMNDFHENDMEGLTLVVDKRFAAPGYPFGQVITLDTRSHNGISRYRNCFPVAGYPVYVKLRHSPSVGCIPFNPSFNTGTSPSPPQRAAVFVNAQSHAVRAFSSSDYPFAGNDGVIYFPSSGPPMVPATLWAGPPTPYAIQWMDSTEVNAFSLWSQRRNAIITSTNTLFEHDAGNLVGPHDVYYLKQFSCNDNCPWGFPTRAKAPWGIPAGGGDRLGDWHNHPAYAWTRQWAPNGSGSGYFDYTCLTDDCRRQNRYIHNVYWDDTPYSGTGYTGGGGSTCSTCPKTSAGTERPPRFGAEHRWDFAVMDGVGIRGEASHRLVSLPDQDWGYAGGTLTALRIEGRGTVTVSFDLPISPERIDLGVARLRRTRGRPVSVRSAWVADGEQSASATQSASLVQHSVSAHQWEMLKLDLRDLTGWKSLRRVRRFELTFEFDSQASTTVDLDFVILAP